MELKCLNLQKEIVALQEEVKATNSLKQDADKHGFPSVLATCVTGLEGSLEDAEK